MPIACTIGRTRGVHGASIENGRGDRIRTYDPLVPNQMRYQAALLPDWPWPLGFMQFGRKRKGLGAAS